MSKKSVSEMSGENAVMQTTFEVDRDACSHEYECVYEGWESETYQCKHCGDRYKLYDDEMR
jgi:hypothetical protein